MITREEVLNIANLSKLYLDESQIKDAQNEMDGMINFVNEINTVSSDIDEIPDMSGVSNAFHEDEVVESYPRSEILKNVNGGKDGFFFVKKFN